MYTKLCGITEVPIGDFKQFILEKNEILVVNLNGQFFCLDARCTHAGAPLERVSCLVMCSRVLGMALVSISGTVP